MKAEHGTCSRLPSQAPRQREEKALAQVAEQAVRRWEVTARVAG